MLRHFDLSQEIFFTFHGGSLQLLDLYELQLEGQVAIVVGVFGEEGMGEEESILY